jgi:hypothetical protein
MRERLLVARRLDFIVYGLPRSGTTAMARALNAHTKILCGIERFSPRHDHAEIIFPESFYDKKYEASKANIARTETYINRKGTNFVHVGNKTPRYYLRLDKILDSLRRPKAILCARSIEEAARSWDSLEHAGGGSWADGRVGLFAAAEAPLCLAATCVADTREIVISPYGAFARDSDATLRRILSLLFPNLGADVDPTLWAEAEEIGRAHVARPKPSIDDRERQALGLIRAEEIDAILDLPAPTAFDQVRPRVLRHLAALPDDLIDRIVALAGTYGRSEVSDFAAGWRRPVDRLWRRLLPQIRSEVDAARGVD